MLRPTFRILAALVCAGLGGCSQETGPSPRLGETSSALRSITASEASADFEQLASAVRAMYGAMPRKEGRYGFSFETLVSEARARLATVSTEPEYYGLLSELLARLEDAHVSLYAGVDSDESKLFTLPLLVMPVENTFVVYALAEGLPELSRGDELLSIDGVPTAELAERLAISTGAPNPQTLRHFAAHYLTVRLPHMSTGLQNGQPVALRVRSAEHGERTVNLAWSEAPHVLPPVTAEAHPDRMNTTRAVSASVQRVVSAELGANGVSWPFFMTPEVGKAFGVAKDVVPSANALARFEVSAEAAAAQPFTAFSYEHCGAKILLLRVPHYDVMTLAEADDSLNYLRALFFEQQPQVDGLILDQTHNSGGSVYFAGRMASLFVTNPAGGIVQKMHADRQWIQFYLDSAREVRTMLQEENPAQALELEAYAHQIDVAYSTGEALSVPMPLPWSESVYAPDDFGWKKPFVMLVDELSGSMGDAVPLVIQASRAAPIFGARTVGAGGTVEQVAVLGNSAYALYLSRGLLTVFDPTGAYPEANFIEDQGVTPDIAYSHSLADFRAGYTGYVRAFSDALVAQLRRAD